MLLTPGMTGFCQATACGRPADMDTGLAQAHLLRASQRLAPFLRRQRLFPQARQGFVKLCVKIEIGVCGAQVRKQGMAGGARKFGFIRRPAKVLNDLRLGHLEIVVAHKCGDAGGGTHRGRGAVGNGNVEAAGQRRFEENSGNYLRSQSGRRRFAPRYRGARFGPAKSAARVSTFTF